MKYSSRCILPSRLTEGRGSEATHLGCGYSTPTPHACECVSPWVWAQATEAKTEAENEGNLWKSHKVLPYTVSASLLSSVLMCISLSLLQLAPASLIHSNPFVFPFQSLSQSPTQRRMLSDFSTPIASYTLISHHLGDGEWVPAANKKKEQQQNTHTHTHPEPPVVAKEGRGGRR